MKSYTEKASKTGVHRGQDKLRISPSKIFTPLHNPMLWPLKRIFLSRRFFWVSQQRVTSTDSKDIVGKVVMYAFFSRLLGTDKDAASTTFQNFLVNERSPMIWHSTELLRWDNYFEWSHRVLKWNKDFRESNMKVIWTTGHEPGSFMISFGFRELTCLINSGLFNICVISGFLWK